MIVARFNVRGRRKVIVGGRWSPEHGDPPGTMKKLGGGTTMTTISSASTLQFLLLILLLAATTKAQ